MSRDQVLAAALALPVDERAALAAELLRTIDGEADPDAASAWDAEIERRIAKSEAGEGGGSSADEVLARARRRLR